MCVWCRTVGVHDHHGCLAWLSQHTPLAGIGEGHIVSLHTLQGNARVSDGERHTLHSVSPRGEGDGARDDPDRGVGLGTRGCGHQDGDWYVRGACLLNDYVSCGVCGVVIICWLGEGDGHSCGMGKSGEPMECQ